MACCKKPDTGIRQMETADLLIEVVGKDDALANTKDIVVSMVQGTERLDYHKDDLVIADNAIAVFLTQEDSGTFDTGNVAVQLNILYEDGRRAVSDTGVFAVYGNLYLEVME